MKPLTAVDLFCGAGGESEGLLQAAGAAGLPLDLTAINHWDIAVETHSRNHPYARHLCETLDSVDPRKVRRSADTVFGAAIDRKAKPPEDSWWACPPSAFKAAHENELPRILRNSARIMPSREGAPVVA